MRRLSAIAGEIRSFKLYITHNRNGVMPNEVEAAASLDKATKEILRARYFLAKSPRYDETQFPLNKDLWGFFSGVDLDLVG